jgi:hypothetical protein
MARALLVADPLFAATTDNDVPEARPGQTSDDTLTASEPHRACGHGLDLLRPHAEKRMLKQETGTEMLPAQPRSDASHATEQAQEQAALQLRELGHAGQHTQHLSQHLFWCLLTGIRDSTVSAFRSFERSRSAMQTAVARPDLDKIWAQGARAGDPLFFSSLYEKTWSSLNVVPRRAWSRPQRDAEARASRGAQKGSTHARIKGGPSQYPERLLRSPFSGSPG